MTVKKVKKNVVKRRQVFVVGMHVAGYDCNWGFVVPILESRPGTHNGSRDDVQTGSERCKGYNMDEVVHVHLWCPGHSSIRIESAFR